jgi:hypothetical protein
MGGGGGLFTTGGGGSLTTGVDVEPLPPQPASMSRNEEEIRNTSSDFTYHPRRRFI